MVAPGTVDGKWFQDSGVVQSGKKGENGVGERKHSVLFFTAHARKHDIGQKHSANRQRLVRQAKAKLLDPLPRDNRLGRRLFAL